MFQSVFLQGYWERDIKKRETKEGEIRMVVKKI